MLIDSRHLKEGCSRAPKYMTSVLDLVARKFSLFMMYTSAKIIIGHQNSGGSRCLKGGTGRCWNKGACCSSSEQIFRSENTGTFINLHNCDSKISPILRNPFFRLGEAVLLPYEAAIGLQKNIPPHCSVPVISLPP